MRPLSTSLGGRVAYLDWLRFLVVLSLAPFHAAISFTGMGSVYVYDIPVRDILLAGSQPVGVGPLVLTEFTVFMDNWFMHLLFLVSGIGAALSLRKRSGAQFFWERCSRLLLPLLFGTVLVVSVQSWLRALSFGRFSGCVLEFRSIVHVPGTVRTTGQELLWPTAAINQGLTQRDCFLGRTAYPCLHRSSSSFPSGVNGSPPTHRVGGSQATEPMYLVRRTPTTWSA